MENDAGENDDASGEKMMSIAQFDRDALASWYADRHLDTDPAISEVVYLPTDASEREIRFIEINEMIAERSDDTLEPVEFGVDMGTEAEHTLYVLDLTPSQWKRIGEGTLALPAGWSLNDAKTFARSDHE